MIQPCNFVVLQEFESKKIIKTIRGKPHSKNNENTLKLRNKGVGIKDKIIYILNNIPGGVYHFEVATIFRASYLLSSMLSNSEVWYGVTKAEIELLEQVDEMLLREISDCSRNVPRDLLYLEFGLVPISYVIKMRTLMFYTTFFTKERSPCYTDFSWLSYLTQQREIGLQK